MGKFRQVAVNNAVAEAISLNLAANRLMDDEPLFMGKRGCLTSNSKFRTILRRSSDRPNYQKLLSSLGVRLSELSNFEFGIAVILLLLPRFTLADEETA